MVERARIGGVPIRGVAPEEEECQFVGWRPRRRSADSWDGARGGRVPASQVPVDGSLMFMIELRMAKNCDRDLSGLVKKSA